MTDNPKTEAQRNAIHKWFEQVADVLNANGIEKRIVLERLQARGIEAEWTKESFKEDVYKPIFQRVTGGKYSTEQASTKDHDICVKGLQKWAASELGIVLPPFPSRYSQGDE